MARSFFPGRVKTGIPSKAGKTHSWPQLPPVLGPGVLKGHEPDLFERVHFHLAPEDVHFSEPNLGSLTVPPFCLASLSAHSLKSSPLPPPGPR